MTYNFDPDRWYEDQCARVEARRRSGEIDAPEAEEELAALARRYEDMVARLDRTYQLPPAAPARRRP